ncbi:MAG: metal ABC transporter ATP-binding protein [Pseudomonadota bacterium]
MTRPSLLKTTGLCLSQGRRDVIDNVDLELSLGEIVTIVGPNGSGKTTLLKGLIGAIDPSSGEIQRAPNLKIGYVPQKLALDATFPLTVRRFLNLPKPRTGRDIARVLAQTGASGLEKRAVQDLSGGQFQRVLLARALMDDPNLLMLDEPTTGLDQAGCAQFYKEIAALRDTTGCAVLMVSHDLHVVMAASDRVICLNGHVCCQGTPAHVAADPAYRALFGKEADGAFALYRHEHDHTHHHDHEPVGQVNAQR